MSKTWNHPKTTRMQLDVMHRIVTSTQYNWN